MDRLVVRDLGEDGVERSSAGVVYLLDTEKGTRRLHVLEEALGAFVDVAPDVLLEPTEGVVQRLLELPTFRAEYVDVAPEGLLVLIGGLTQPQLLHVLHDPKGGYTDRLHLPLDTFHLVAYLGKDRLRRRCRRKCR